MFNHRAALSGALIVGVAFVGACSDISPTAPGAGPVDSDAPGLFRGSAQDPGAFQGTLDAAFIEIARQHPGFGGLFYDADGALTVYVKRGVQPLATPALAAPLKALGVDVSAQPVRVREARYDFTELAAMHRAVTPVLHLAGVVFTDADEARNRVTVGVTNDAAAAAVERALAMAGVKREAVIIERTEEIKTDQQLLTQRVRPVAGGLQVNFLDLGVGYVCSLGFNVRAAASASVQGFVTNSHCSETRGAVTPNEYWQESRFTANTFIGMEEYDLPFFQGGVCPAGRNCRYSDALGVRYAEGVEVAFGEIYRTTGIGSLQIDPATPRWQIVDELPFPIVGQILHKTGRTTGWTSGPVASTCVNSNVAGAGEITMLCQDRIVTNSAGGDSGSPYFERIGDTNRVRLVGIHWGSGGGQTVMSAMANIRYENVGPGGWITYPGQPAPPNPGDPR